jgi:taurine--2-oxoglutarate transaminase
MGVRHVPPPYAYRCPFGSKSDDECGRRAAEAVASCIGDEGTATVAAVIMEPDAGTNGIVAPDSYWPALRRATAERGVYLIADEVMSGFGRCGEWFAWQRYGEDGRPDLMTLAKGLTGAALPLGAVVLSRAVAAKLEHEMLYTGLTYCGHPLSCAAGVAALAAYEEEQLIGRSRAMGPKLLSDLKQLQARHPVIGDVRGGHGLLAVVELIADRTTRAPLSPWPQQPPALKALIDAAFAEGVSFASRGNLLIIAPPLVIAERELADALSLLDRLLARFFPSKEASAA